MRLEELLKQFDTHGIRYNHKCADLSVLGYDPNLGGQIIKDLSEIYDSIVNSTGVSKSIRDYVKQLSDILADLTTDISAKDRTKQQKKYDKVKERFSTMWGKKTKEIAQNDHLTEPVNEILKDAKAAIDVITDVVAQQPTAKRYDRIRANLPKCSKLLDELQGIVDGVHDVSSKEAAQHAAALIDGLSAWAKNSLQFLTMRTQNVQELEKVVEGAKKWAKINQPGEKKNMATEKEIRTYNPANSYFTVIKNIIHVTEQYEDLNVTYEEYCQGSVKLQESFEDISQQRTVLAGKKQEILIAYKNGKMPPVEAKQRVEEVQRKMDTLERRSAEINNRLVRSNKHRESISAIVSELRMILDQQLDEANGNPMVLSTLLPYIPFEELKAIMVGNYTPEALSDLKTKYSIMKEQIRQLEQDVMGLDNEVTLVEDVSLFGDSEVRLDSQTANQDAANFMDSLFEAEMGGGQTPAPDAEEEITEGNPLSELDDLFMTPGQNN